MRPTPKAMLESPRQVLATFLVGGVLLAFFAARVYVAPGLDELLISGEDLERNEEIKQEFSNDEILVLAFDLGRAVDAQAFEQVAALREQIEQVAGVDEVVDLSVVEGIRAASWDPEALDVGPLLPQERSIESIRDELSGHPLFEDTVISRDQHVVSLLVIPDALGITATDPRSSLFETQADVNAAVVSAVYEIASKQDLPIWIAGYPAAEVEAQQIVLSDLLRLGAFAFLALTALAALVFRDARAVLILCCVIGWTQLCALAWLGATDTPLSIVLATLPTILMATSATYALYVLSLSRGLDGSPRDRASQLLDRAQRALVLSAASTGAGFLALCMMPIPAIRDLGAALAVGATATLIGTLYLVPALLQITRLRLERRQDPHRDRIVTLGARLSRSPAPVLVATSVIAGIAVLGIAQLELESEPLTFWKDDHFHRRSDDFLRENFGGSLFVNAVLSTPGEPEGVLTPEVLSFARDWMAEATSSPVVVRAHSLLDVLALVDDVLAPDADRSYLTRPGVAAEYLIAYEGAGDPDDLRHAVNFDRSSLNLLLRVSSRSSSDILALRDDLEAFARNRPDGTTAEVLGTWLLFPEAMDGISRGMVRGLALAALVIFGVLWLLLRSIRLAAVAMIPNTLPVLLCLGLLGWLGIPLSFATSIVGCIALGLAVDDTAHVVGHLRHGRRLEGVYRQVGPALFLTTSSLAAAFLVFLGSGFQPLVHFGIATTLSLLLALLCDLLVLPALLRVSGLVADGRIVLYRQRRRFAPQADDADLDPTPQLPHGATR